MPTLPVSQATVFLYSTRTPSTSCRSISVDGMKPERWDANPLFHPVRSDVLSIIDNPSQTAHNQTQNLVGNGEQIFSKGRWSRIHHARKRLYQDNPQLAAHSVYYLYAFSVHPVPLNSSAGGVLNTLTSLPPHSCSVKSASDMRRLTSNSSPHFSQRYSYSGMLL